jgi:cystathionine beta-synthase
LRNVHDNILSCIGDTPIVRVNRLATELKSTLYMKLEMLNPGGSIKDRIALQMVDDAEAAGELGPGSSIVEGTSGNTGAGLAMVGVVRGYRSAFVMPDKQSEEKRAALRAYGARVVVTPTAVEPEDPRSYYSVSRRMGSEPQAWFANQYHNPSNPAAHYASTGPELWEQMDGKIDAFVAGLGTGGTISGIGRYLKEKNPDIKIIGVDPVGSLYYDYFHTGQMTEPHTYVVEGIGEDFMPSTIDWQYIDDVVRVNDKECFQMTRRIVREEGVFCGGSCGAAVAGALKWMRLRENGFMDPDYGFGSVRDLLRDRGDRDLIAVAGEATVNEVVGIMKLHGISQVPVVGHHGKLTGILSETNLLERALRVGGGHTQVQELTQANYTTVDPDTEITVLIDLFRRAKVVFVVEGHKPTSIITKIDLIDYISRVTGSGEGA